MPEFTPGEEAIAKVTFSNRKDVAFDCEAFLYMGTDLVVMSQVSFTLDAREEKQVLMSVTMPDGSGDYPVKVAVYDNIFGFLVERQDIDIVIEEGIMPQGARVYSSVDQYIPNMLNTPIAFNSENYDTDNIHDPANNSRLVCRTAGIYFIHTQIMFEGNAIGYRVLNIAMANLNIPHYSYAISFKMMYGNTSPYACYLESSTLWNMLVDDYVEAVVYQNSGANLRLFPGQAYPVFAMHRIG